MKKIALFFALLLIAALFPFLIYAQEGFNFGGAQGPQLRLPTTEAHVAVRRVTDIIFYATVLIAVVMIVWGGVVLATAGGDTGKVDMARHMIMYALIAIAVGSIAWGLVNLVASYVAGAGAAGAGAAGGVRP